MVVQLQGFGDSCFGKMQKYRGSIDQDVAGDHWRTLKNTGAVWVQFRFTCKKEVWDTPTKSM
jgi:hypothetical protein